MEYSLSLEQDLRRQFRLDNMATVMIDAIMKGESQMSDIESLDDLSIPQSLDIKHFDGFKEKTKDIYKFEGKTFFSLMSDKVKVLEQIDCSSDLATVNTIIRLLKYPNLYGIVAKVRDKDWGEYQFYNLSHPFRAIDMCHRQILQRINTIYLYEKQECDALASQLEPERKELTQATLDYLCLMYKEGLLYKYTTDEIDTSKKQDEEWLRSHIIISKDLIDSMSNTYRWSNDVLFDVYENASTDPKYQTVRKYLYFSDLLTHNSFIPYYAIFMLMIRNGTMQGYYNQYIPCTSPNINMGHTVCTGKERNTTSKGVNTLLHSNLSSPFYTTIMQKGFGDYVDMCIKKSLEIYQQYLDERTANDGKKD